MLDLVEYSRIWNVIFLDGFEADTIFSPLPLPLASRVRCLTYVVGSYNMCLFLILAVQLVHFLLFSLGIIISDTLSRNHLLALLISSNCFLFSLLLEI